MCASLAHSGLFQPSRGRFFFLRLPPKKKFFMLPQANFSRGQCALSSPPRRLAASTTAARLAEHAAAPAPARLLDLSTELLARGAPCYVLDLKVGASTNYSIHYRPAPFARKRWPIVGRSADL